MPSWKKVITSGSAAALSSLTVTNGITGSLFGTASWAVSSSRATTSSYALTSSYSLNPTISGSISQVDYIDFNTGSATPAWKSGRVFWDNTEGSLAVYNAEADITLNVGQENWTRVWNATGVTIHNGDPVRIVGTHGDAPQVVLAQSIAVSGSSNLVNQILGVATHDIEANTFGFITTQGLVHGLDTSAFTDGATLYVSSSAGQYTTTVPSAPYEIIPVGQVVKASPGGSGIIYVAVQQPLDFTDLSSVHLGASDYADGELWAYDGPSKSWKHTRQLSGSYGITGSVNATSFTGSLFGTSSWAASASNAVNAQTASFVTASNVYGPLGSNSITSASFAVSSSRAVSSSYAITSSYSNTSTSASFATTASYVLQAVSASFASTASYVNTLNQSVLITGSTTIGSSSLGASENTLTLGPSPAGGTGEGGQLGLNAVGGTYTSASFIDNWQNTFRILRGTNASSTGLVAQWNLQTLQMQLPAYNSPTAQPGTVSGLLAFDTSGNIITTTTGSGGGGGVTINNNVDNYIVTATGTANTLNGESGLQYNGTSLTVTGQVTASGAITSTANGAMYFRGGDDAEFWDINVANTVGIYGQQNADRAGLKLGSSGPTLFGSASRFGIGTTTPTSGTLEVSGNVYATSFTGSLFGTSSWAVSASWAPTPTTVATASFVTASNVYGPFGSNSVVSASNATTASYVLQAVSSSFASTASFYGGTVTTASYALTASNVQGGAANYIPLWNTATSLSSSTIYQSSGNVGVGSLGGNTPRTLLSIVGANDAAPALGSANGKFTVLNNVGTSGGYGLVFGVQGTGASHIQNQRVDGTATAYALSLQPVGGNLGVGTTTPTATLDVSGSVNISGSGVQVPLQVYSGSTPLLFVSQSGNIGIRTSTPSASLHVAGTTRLSGSLPTISGSILTVIGSGSTQPIFTVQGSQGELFSVTDSLSGSLFSVNDISGLPILEVFSDNTTLVGNYQAPALVTTAKNVLTNSGSFTIYSIPTASYDGAFFEYTAKSGSNARAGQIMAIWSGTSVNYTETVTTDFGTTSGLSLNVSISGSNMVLTGSASTTAWTIKTIVRSI